MQHDTIPSEYVAGQVWRYKTRPCEAESTLTILHVDHIPNLGEIVHIMVTGLSMSLPGGGTGERIGHLPMSAASMNNSVTELAAFARAIPDYREGYGIWRREFDAGKAGVFSITVAECIDALESIASSCNG